MAKCLYCGLELTNKEKHYHEHCLRDFFGTSKIESFDFEHFEKSFNEQVNSLIEKKAAITGVQKKLSIGLSNDKKKLTVFGYPLGYIIKPENDEFKEIARAEELVMNMANYVGIKTPKHMLLPFGKDRYAYIIKRMDRENEKKIHMEDMCQLSNKPTEYKYNGSYEYLGKLINKFCNNNVAELVEYYYRLLFCFVTCNSDMHLKNFSLIEADEIRLSPAYDLLPVNIIYPNDKEQVALTLNGKKKNLARNDFVSLANSLNINEHVVSSLFKKIYSYKSQFVEMIKNSLLSEKTKDYFIDELIKRIEVFA